MSDDSVIMGICGADGLCGLCAGEDRTGTDGCGSYFRAATLIEPLAKPEKPTCLGPNMDCGRALPCPDHPDRSWQCPVEGHRYRSDRDGVPLATVEWDGDVAGCLAYGCGRISTDRVPRGDCWCDGYTDGQGTTECTGQCCGPGQCSCTPDQATTVTARQPSGGEA